MRRLARDRAVAWLNGSGDSRGACTRGECGSSGTPLRGRSALHDPVTPLEASAAQGVLEMPLFSASSRQPIERLEPRNLFAVLPSGYVDTLVASGLEQPISVDLRPTDASSSPNSRDARA